MEKLTFREACRIYCECKAISETECKNCPLNIIKDSRDKDLCTLFGIIKESIINYNKEISMEEK